MSACPCCGFKEGTGSPFEIAKTLRLTENERALFNVFAKNFGSFLSIQKLADAVYADDPNGGPDSAENCIAVAMANFRKKVGARGLEIDAMPGPGGGRRMIWTKAGRSAKK